ncbi:G patch domain-containing protein 4 [Anolis carolinensis]|uniref:G patch domain-containing protein 4 n=1 Tax=Anolis carolinensis TaxID=28377 RepID=UPI002F2B5341
MAAGVKSRGLAFAEKELRRRGWKEGKGLGKHETGISEALRVKVKCNSAGVGHDPGEAFSFHWWDHLFNASAAKIAIQQGQNGVKVGRVSEKEENEEEEPPARNKKPRKALRNKDMVYGRFVKAATLTSKGEEPLNPVHPSDSSSEEEEAKLDLSSAKRLTDEELVKACGGRTAHKGARHGFTMSAKLARLEEQEKAFLAKYLPPKAPNLEQKEEKKAKRRKEEAIAILEEEPEEGRPKKKKKKKKRKKEEEENVDEEPLGQSQGRKKAKRKTKGHSDPSRSK